MASARSFLAVFAVLSCYQPVLAQSVSGTDFWRVSQEKANCIVGNIDAYLSRPGAIVLIPVDSCPNVDPFADAMKGRKNQSGLMAEVNTQKETEKTVKFISYPKSQLKCLKGIQIEIDSEGLALLPKSVTCD